MPKICLMDDIRIILDRMKRIFQFFLKVRIFLQVYH